MNRWIAVVCSLVLIVLFSVGAMAKTPITMWMLYQGPAEFWVKQWEAKFNEENPDIELTIETSPANPREAVVVQVAAGVGPDIMYEVDSVMGRWVENDFALPIDRYFESMADKDDFLPDVIDGMRYDGQLRAMPFMIWPWANMYNKEVFASSGVGDFPNTWDEMIAAAKAMTRMDADGNIVQWGWRTWRNAAYIMALNEALFRQLGTTIVEDGMTKTQLNHDEGHRVLSYMQELWRIAGNNRAAASTHDLVQGGGGIYYGWSGAERQTIVDNYPDVGPETIGFARYPGPEPHMDNVQFMSANLMILSSSPNPDAAWRVIEAFLEPENLKEYLLVRGMLSARQSHFLDADLLNQPFTQELMSLVYPPMLLHGTKHQRYELFRTDVGNEFIRAFDDQISITEALIRAEDAINIRLVD